MHMSFNFGKDIMIIKGIHQNGFSSYFGEFNHLDCYNLIVCCSFGSSFGHLVCYFGYYFANSMALF